MIFFDCRTLTQTEDHLENSPDCGALTEPKSEEMRIKMIENECLSSCTWQANPFFKTRPEGFDVHYGTKWYERFFTGDNTFPQLHDSPMVPKDLSCLSSCFVRYKSAPSEILTTIQRECSNNGIDRQIPTHLETGTMMVEDNFTNIISIPPVFNPNLDCLVYYETKERRRRRTVICLVALSMKAEQLGNDFDMNWSKE